MARKSGYTSETGDRIIEQLADGMSALAISKLEGMPNERTIRRWAVDPELSDPDFVPKYARAREMGADHEFDRIEELEDRLESGDIDPHVARVLIDSIKWRLSKKLPCTYGDRSHLEVSGGLAVESVKDHAPEWLSERLAGGEVEVIEPPETD